MSFPGTRNFVGLDKGVMSDPGHRENGGASEWTWRGYRVVRVNGLAAPLLLIQTTGGILACAYISTATTDRLKEACAIVKGVRSPEDMCAAKVVAVSAAAAAQGVQVGMSGEKALEIMSRLKTSTSRL